MKLERIVTFSPAFDKRDPIPSKNYGIGAVRCIMALKGSKGAITFVFSTGMYLEDTHKNWLSKFPSNSAPYMGFDVGYHSGRKHFKGQYLANKSCEWRNGKPCYSDGSSLRADDWMKVLVEKGSEEIWKMMEKEYADEFAPKKNKKRSTPN